MLRAGLGSIPAWAQVLGQKRGLLRPGLGSIPAWAQVLGQKRVLLRPGLGLIPAWAQVLVLPFVPLPPLFVCVPLPSPFVGVRVGAGGYGVGLLSRWAATASKTASKQENS